MIQFPQIQSEIQFIDKFNETELFLLREDLIHPKISGNKYRKLQYNLEEYSKVNYDALLTFGGAYSNHISAAAAAGMEFGIPTIGIIRGEELFDKVNENPTLSYARECGMQFKFASREDYRNKNTAEFAEMLRKEFGNVYILPEGGTNEFAVKGCEEILGEHTKNFDYITVPIGTGGTISGVINSSLSHQKTLGFPALKDSGFLKDEIKQFTTRSNFELIRDYSFGGFAKISDELIGFINSFKEEYNVNLDPIYTGKMLFGIFELLKNGYFEKNSRILAIHTGGLQGIEGMNQRLERKNKKMIIQ